MLFKVGNLYTHVVGAPSEIDWVRATLSYSDTSGMFVRNPITGKVERATDSDGNPMPIPKVSVLDPRRNRFPTGLLGELLEKARAAQYTVELEDMRVRPDCDASIELAEAWIESTGRQFRAVQRRALEVTLSVGRGIIRIATGGGKTVFAMGLVAATPGARWLCIVPSGDLLRNMKEEYEKSFPGEKCGVIQGKRCDLDCNFTVATYHTLSKRIRSHPEVRKFVKQDVDGVIDDECHTSAAAQHYVCLMNIDSAYFRVGLSGTPTSRSDGKNIFVIGAFGRELISIGAAELVDDGVLARPTIHMVKVVQSGEESMDWKDDYDRFVVYSRYRMAVCVWLFKRIVERGEDPCLILYWSLDHGAIIEKVMKKLGMSCELVQGSTPQIGRKRVIESVKSGRVQFTIASSVFVTGVDIPQLRSLVRVMGKKDEIGVIQGTGRVLRKTESVQEVAVYDIFDERPAKAERERQFGNKYNERHSRKRKKIYESEGHRVVDLKPFC